MRLLAVYVADKSSVISCLRGLITPPSSGEELQAPGKVRPTLHGGIARAYHRNAILRLIRGMNLRLHPCSVAPAERPEKCGPRRPTRAGSSCNNAPRRLHLKDRRGAGTGSPRPRPWTSHLASDGANRRCSDGTAGRRQRSAGDGRRGVGVSHSTAEAGELSPRDPVEGRGHRQVAPLEGKTANTPRLGPVSTSRHRIAELARQA